MMYVSVSRNNIAIVDDEDYEIVGNMKWCISTKGYALHRLSKDSFGKRRMINMHRLIMNAPAGLQVDHINGNPLDNRKCNLRLCTHAENQRNSGKYLNNKSGYKGVSWNKNQQKWESRISVDGKKLFLGLFYDSMDAAKAYDEAALKYHKEFAKINNIMVGG